jgi:hypothetical protein
MAIDGGYPRAITIVVPANIPLGEAGLYVSLEVSNILDELGTAHVLRRSVSLRFLDPRTALLQFESTQGLNITPEQRSRFNAAKAAVASPPTPEPAAVLEPKALPAAAPNKGKRS